MTETPTRFAEVAATLAANGYRPLPVRPRDKNPGFKDWPTFQYVAGCEARFPEHGCGVIGGNVVAIDIDVDDEGAAAAVEQAVREILNLGDAAEIPRRFGRWPRVLLPCRSSTPYRKIKTAEFVLRSTGTKAHVEVLAEGEQFVVFGVHKDTGKPYTWNGGGDPLTVPRSELPELTVAQARAVVVAAEGVLDEWGDRVEHRRDDDEDHHPVDHRPVDRSRVLEGGRNDYLTREAGKLRRLGLSAAAIEGALQVLNRERCDPPLERAEVDAIAASIGRYEAPREEATGEATWPDAIDLIELAKRAPKPPAFIVRDWLPAGYATLFAGHGGSGKSAIALHLAVSIACGRSFFGLPTEQRRVTYLSCEDRADVLHWRLARICEYEGTSIAELAGWLDLRDLVGHDVTLWARDPRTGDTVTPAFDRFACQVEEHHPQVLFIDGISDAFAGSENVRSEVKAFVNRLLSLTPLDGALMLIGHVAKLTAQATGSSEGYSGSTSWHNSVRGRWYLYPETEPDEDTKRARRTGRLTLELQKSNLGPTDQALTFRWDTDAHLFLAETVTADHLDRRHRDDTEQRGILAAIAGCEAAGIIVPSATQGRRTTFNVLRDRPEFPATLRGSTGRFWRHIEALRGIHHIGEAEYRRADRHPAAKFVLTPEGRGQCGH